jgi:hypothetical protein
MEIKSVDDYLQRDWEMSEALSSVYRCKVGTLYQSHAGKLR